MNTPSHHDSTHTTTPLHVALDDALDRFHRTTQDRELDAWRRHVLSVLHDHFGASPALTTEICRSHPLFSLLHKDPYHSRAWHKPRGYPGDAAMLDMIYDGEPERSDASIGDDGQKIFRTWNRCDGCQAVRERARHIARAIEKAATTSPNTRVLSIACGHLREIEQVHPPHLALIDEFVGFDQDAESIARLEAHADILNVTPAQGKIRDLLREEDRLGGDWDLIYSSGLFDYLDDRVATTLIDVLLRRLRPGGRLLIANFKETRELLWGHIFQDWRLICREDEDLAKLVPSTITHARTYSGPYGIMSWLDVTST